MQSQVKLTKTQILILYLFYRFRFLTRTHIQKLLSHKSHSLVSDWVSNLRTQGYLLKKAKLDPTDIREPDIFYLSSKSIQVLKNNQECHKKILRKFYRENQRSDEFANQCLNVTDLYLLFTDKYKNATLNFYTQSDYIEYDYLPKPTCYLSIKFPEKRKATKRYFIEVIAPNTYKFILKNLIRKYLVYLNEGEWLEITHYSFPIILLICHDSKMKRWLQRYLKEQVYNEYDEKEILFKIHCIKDRFELS